MRNHLSRVQIRAHPEGFILREAGFFDPIIHQWSWAKTVIAAEFECDEDEISLNDDDCITVRGEPVATMKLGSYS